MLPFGSVFGLRLFSTDLNEPSAEEQREREARRAEKRLQVLTKEADWRIARAYVAVSDPADSYEEGKKSGGLEAGEGGC